MRLPETDDLDLGMDDNVKHNGSEKADHSQATDPFNETRILMNWLNSLVFQETVRDNFNKGNNPGGVKFSTDENEAVEELAKIVWCDLDTSKKIAPEVAKNHLRNLVAGIDLPITNTKRATYKHMKALLLSLNKASYTCGQSNQANSSSDSVHANVLNGVLSSLTDEINTQVQFTSNGDEDVIFITQVGSTPVDIAPVNPSHGGGEAPVASRISLKNEECNESPEVDDSSLSSSPESYYENISSAEGDFSDRDFMPKTPGLVVQSGQTKGFTTDTMATTTTTGNETITFPDKTDNVGAKASMVIEPKSIYAPNPLPVPAVQDSVLRGCSICMERLSPTTLAPLWKKLANSNESDTDSSDSECEDCRSDGDATHSMHPDVRSPISRLAKQEVLARQHQNKRSSTKLRNRIVPYLNHLNERLLGVLEHGSITPDQLQAAAVELEEEKLGRDQEKRQLERTLGNAKAFIANKHAGSSGRRKKKQDSCQSETVREYLTKWTGNELIISGENENFPECGTEPFSDSQGLASPFVPSNEDNTNEDHECVFLKGLKGLITGTSGAASDRDVSGNESEDDLSNASDEEEEAELVGTCTRNKQRADPQKQKSSTKPTCQKSLDPDFKKLMQDLNADLAAISSVDEENDESSSTTKDSKKTAPPSLQTEAVSDDPMDFEEDESPVIVPPSPRGSTSTLSTPPQPVLAETDQSPDLGPRTETAPRDSSNNSESKFNEADAAGPTVMTVMKLPTPTIVDLSSGTDSDATPVKTRGRRKKARTRSRKPNGSNAAEKETVHEVVTLSGSDSEDNLSNPVTKRVPTQVTLGDDEDDEIQIVLHEGRSEVELIKIRGQKRKKPPSVHLDDSESSSSSVSTHVSSNSSASSGGVSDSSESPEPKRVKPTTDDGAKEILPVTRMVKDTTEDKHKIDSHDSTLAIDVTIDTGSKDNNSSRSSCLTPVAQAFTDRQSVLDESQERTVSLATIATAKLARKPPGRRNIRPIIEYETPEAKAQAEKLKAEGEESQRLADINRETERMILSEEPLIEVDPSITSHLKPHQREGISFLWVRCFGSVEKIGDCGHGGILSHCMGLGKTLQTLAFLHTVLTHEIFNIKHCVVLCPLSITCNWEYEGKLWLNGVQNTICLYNISAQKKDADKLMSLRKFQKTGGIAIMHYDSVATFMGDERKSSPLLTSSSDQVPVPGTSSCAQAQSVNSIKAMTRALAKDVFLGAEILVCDEGHRLKNGEGKIRKYIQEVGTKRKIILTGTPMQNNLEEFYHLIDLVAPVEHRLGTLKEFANRFITPITNGQHCDSNEFDICLSRKREFYLFEMTSPFVHRRFKILKELIPPKQEFGIFLNLTELQQRLYLKFLEIIGEELVASEEEGNPAYSRRLLGDYSVVQKFCCHPALLYADFENYSPSKHTRQIRSNLKTNMERYVNALITGVIPAEEKDTMKSDMTLSAKMLALKDLVQKAIDRNDKILVFSKYRKTLNLIEHFMAQDAFGWGRLVWRRDYFRIDGKTDVADRDKFCSEFNQSECAQVFLITTKAGGLGVNLHGANRVVMMDVSMNPSDDDQSIFRVYRLGQKKPCFIYRLICRGGMEEKNYYRGLIKSAMGGRIVDQHLSQRNVKQGNTSNMYEFDPNSTPLSAVDPSKEVEDRVFKHFLETSVVFASYVEHETLLQDNADEHLNEEEKEVVRKEGIQEAEDKRKSRGRPHGAKNKRKGKGQETSPPSANDLPLPQSSTQPSSSEHEMYGINGPVPLLRTYESPSVENQPHVSIPMPGPSRVISTTLESELDDNGRLGSAPAGGIPSRPSVISGADSFRKSNEPLSFERIVDHRVHSCIIGRQQELEQFPPLPSQPAVDVLGFDDRMPPPTPSRYYGRLKQSSSYYAARQPTDYPPCHPVDCFNPPRDDPIGRDTQNSQIPPPAYEKF